MTTYYADFDLITGGETGADAANAWRNHQDSIDGKSLATPPLAAADIVLCKGTDTIATRIDQDQGSGSWEAGMITFRGVNSSWANDGTRAIIDGNNNAIDLILFSGTDYIRYENFVFKNTNAASGNDGITGASYNASLGLEFINCVFDDCHDLFFTANAGIRDPFFLKCQFLNAAGNSFDGALSDSIQSTFVQCIFDTASLQHINTSGSPVFLIDCYFLNATGNAVSIDTGIYHSLVYNCTFDGNSDAIQQASLIKIIGSRFTNNTVGIDSDGIATIAQSYMPDTAQDRANTTKTTGIVDEIFLAGSNSNNLSGTDTDGGYAAPATGDFNLDESKASLYNQVVDLET